MLGLQASATISSYHTLDSTRVWCTLRQEFQQPRTSLTLWWRLRVLYTGSHCFQIWRIWLHPTGATSVFSSLTVFVNNSTIISRRVGQLLVFFIYYGMSRDSQTLKQIGIFFYSLYVVLAVLDLTVAQSGFGKHLYLMSHHPRPWVNTFTLLPF